ncbi:MAG: DUF418 domain-containing protein [Planctomycetota bacterium]
MTNLNAPVKKSERILSLDVLRGFALLGILIVNVQSFAMIGAAYNNPTAFGDFEGLNFLVWLITYVFFDSKMMAVFSLLFGAGICLMFERSQQQSGSSAWLHYRRMFWLLLFGLAHAHLLWYGDILFTYAVCGMIVYWCKRFTPFWLTFTGVLLLLVPAALFAFFQLTIGYMPEEQVVQMTADWTPNQKAIDTEVATYSGSWLTQMEYRPFVALMMETFIFGILFFWRASGMMLLGMALFKWKVLNASRSTGFYVRMAAIGLGLGFSIIGYGVYFNLENEFAFNPTMFGGALFNYVGSVFVALGYVAVVMLACKHEVVTWFTRSLQAVGQLALTNYLMQTIVCTTIFYGHGLGLFGSVSRSGQLAIVGSIWIAQLLLSPIWVKKFRFGPFEWLWRSLAYWKIQPMRRHST